MIKAFCFLFVMYLIGHIAVMVKTEISEQFQTSGLELFFLLVFVLLILVVLIGALVVGVGVYDAYNRARRLAQEAGLNLEEYVKTEEYRSRGRQQLRRTDGDPRWQ